MKIRDNVMCSVYWITREKIDFPSKGLARITSAEDNDFGLIVVHTINSVANIRETYVITNNNVPTEQIGRFFSIMEQT